MNPNPEIVSRTREPENDRSPWKIALLGLFGVASSAAMVSEFLNFSTTLRTSYFWISIIAALLFFSFALLQAFFVKGSWKLFLITFLEFAVPLLIFRSRFDAQTLPYLAAACILGIAYIGFALEYGKRLLANSVEPRFFSIAKRILPRLVTGTLLFLSILLYLNYFVWGNFTDALGKTFVTGALSSSAPVIKLWVPNVSFDASVRDFIASLAKDRLQRTSITVVDSGGRSQTFLWNNLPQKQQGEYLQQAITQTSLAFTKQFGEMNQNESMHEFIYGLLKGYVERARGATGSLLPIAAIMLFFFVIKGVAALLSWLIVCVAFIIFKLSVVTGFAEEAVETRNRTFLILP